MKTPIEMGVKVNGKLYRWPVNMVWPDTEVPTLTTKATVKNTFVFPRRKWRAFVIKHNLKRIFRLMIIIGVGLMILSVVGTMEANTCLSGGICP